MATLSIGCYGPQFKKTCSRLFKNMFLLGYKPPEAVPFLCFYLVLGVVIRLSDINLRDIHIRGIF